MKFLITQLWDQIVNTEKNTLFRKTDMEVNNGKKSNCMNKIEKKDMTN